MTRSHKKLAPQTTNKMMITLLSGSIALAISSLSFADSAFMDAGEVQALENSGPLYISDELASDNPSYITEYLDEADVSSTTAPAVYLETETPTNENFVPIFVDSSTPIQSAFEAPAYNAEGSLPVFANTASGVIDERDAPAGYFAQIGAFSSLSNAQNLRNKQSSPAIVVSSESSGKLLYKVQVGPFDSVSQAFEITSDSGEKLIYPHR